MLQTIKDYFLSRLGEAARTAQGAPVASLELAAAVLMVEISMADSTRQTEELDEIRKILLSEFKLSVTDTEKLLETAETQVDHAVSMHEFTRYLNQTLTGGERVRIIELLWRVAFADTILDKYEEYYIRKVADLLYVSHLDFMKAKHKAGGIT